MIFFSIFPSKREPFKSSVSVNKSWLLHREHAIMSEFSNSTRKLSFKNNGKILNGT